jgi:hypothetical protein
MDCIVVIVADDLKEVIMHIYLLINSMPSLHWGWHHVSLSYIETAGRIDRHPLLVSCLRPVAMLDDLTSITAVWTAWVSRTAKHQAMLRSWLCSNPDACD